MSLAATPSPTVLSTDERGQVASPILNSVGRDGANAPLDVYVVQRLLNDRLPRPHSPVPTTGIADVGTVLAIEAYQAVVMNMIPPTGRVEPNSPTYLSLAAHPLAEPVRTAPTGHFGKVPPDVVEAAQLSYRQWGVPASVTLAQWAVESAWGAAMPPDSNNPFGIKATGTQPAVESVTREVEGGQSVFKPQPFRKFNTLAEAFDAHGRLLATSVLYKPAMQHASDPEAFADALTGVYATDPQYGYILKYVIRTYGFGQYDR